jgi:mRNA interferase MazF
MVIERGEIWWADMPAPEGSEPGYRRPVVVIQADGFNRSKIKTVIVVALSSNLALGKLPGNVVLRLAESGLAKDSVMNVSQIVTLNRACLTERVGSVPGELMISLEQGLRMVLDLW